MITGKWAQPAPVFLGTEESADMQLMRTDELAGHYLIECLNEDGDPVVYFLRR